MECRPISKTKSFVVIEKLTPEEIKEDVAKPSRPQRKIASPRNKTKKMKKVTSKVKKSSPKKKGEKVRKVG